MGHMMERLLAKMDDNQSETKTNQAEMLGKMEVKMDSALNEMKEAIRTKWGGNESGNNNQE
jgi:hypothetical protein